MGAEEIWAGQHSTGEDVALDKVRVVAVAFKTFFFDGDHLYCRSAAWLEAGIQGVEIGWPVLFTDSLKHFYGNNVVVLIAGVAVIGEAKFGSAAKAGVRDTLPGIAQLFFG